MAKQVLVDGGPDNSVLDCLSRHMPFWDRKIEVVMLSHPQSDHFAGLIEVLKRYEVDSFVSTGLDSSSSEYQVLKSLVGGSGAKVVNPTRGMVIRLGKMQLDIVHPSNQFLVENGVGQEPSGGAGVLGAFTSSTDPNEFSIVTILSLGEFDVLLTGDIGPDVMDEIIDTGRIRDVEYIKIPHHGSKNGLTKELLEISRPEVAVISAGRNNRYGHPHKEVLNLLTSYELRVLRTDEVGDIEVVTDGKKWWLKF